MLRAVEFAGAFRTRQHIDIVRNRLARREARQKPHQRRHVLEGRYDLLDARDRDVDLGQHRRQRCVALVRHDDDRARFGDKKIAAGDSHVGAQVVLAQHRPCFEA